MKNNNILNKLLKQSIIKLVITLLCISIICIMGVYIAQFFDFQWLYYYDSSLYSFLADIYYLLRFPPVMISFLLLIAIICIVLVFYRFYKKTSSYMNSLTKATHELLDRNVDYIALPDDLYEIEKTLNELKRQARDNERLAKENEQKKDELIVYLAHDIKTPLTSMIGYLSLLDEIKDMPEVQKQRYITIALEKSYRLEDLINELFEVARFNSEKIILEKEDLNVRLMLEQIIDDFYPILIDLDKNIILNQKEDIELYGDPDKLSRVFSNLIKNAINYSKENTDIEMNVFEKEDQVIFEVINQGKTIPQEKLERIFENFYRLDSSRSSKTGGSGLGLAISKQIVELHHGTIHASSTKERTVFTVTLPKN